MKRSFPVDVLWCANRSGGKAYRNGWSFPVAVRKKLQEDFAGKSVLHMFGGLATFGVRLDIDPATKPDVIGDAWLPPFARSSFDVVILDPPYFALNQQEKNSLLRAAAWIAKDTLVWFHTIWIAGDRHIKPYQAFLVRVGDTCACRCLEYFRVSNDKERPRNYFSRGPAMKYNHWLNGTASLVFGETHTSLPAPSPAERDIIS